MTTAMSGHIIVADDGVARIAGSRSRVIDVVLDQRANGWTARQIHQEYPHLSLAQIHAAFAYYYDHEAELDAEIDRRLAEVEQLRASAGESPIARRLRSSDQRP